MHKKIDFYVGGRYVCSSCQYPNLKAARDGFLKNPSWQGLRADGTLGKVSIQNPGTVTVWWSDR